MIAMLEMMFIPYKAEWQLNVPPASQISNCAFCIYRSFMSLEVNSDYFLDQRQQVDLCNGEMWYSV
jgi:hypothetical protein